MNRTGMILCMSVLVALFAVGLLNEREPPIYVCNVDEVLGKFETTFEELGGETIYTRGDREFIFPGRGAVCERKKEEVP